MNNNNEMLINSSH